MKTIRNGLMAALIALAVPSLALADETVTDWKGEKITLQEGDVDSHGVNIHYYTAGEGPLLIISHGNGDYWFGWRNQIPTFAKHYKVVLYDLRGFNKSGHPTGLENNTNAKFEDDLLALQDHFKVDKAIHIGHDQGGMVLWGFAMDHPDRVKLLIEMNSIHPRAFVRDLAGNPAQVKASWYIQQLKDDPVKGLAWEKAVMDPASPRHNSDPADIRKMWADAYKRTTDAGLQGTTDWYSVNFPGRPFSPDAKAFGYHGSAFPQIKSPTLVIHALSDSALMARGVDELGQWIDNEFTLVTVREGNHFLQMDTPERFNTIVSHWLDDHGALAPDKKLTLK